MLTEFAPAKVNLYLHVVGRRPDGYHLLDSLAVFASAADRLHATPGRGLSLRLEGPFGAGLAAEPDNLVLRAARALAEATGAEPDAALVLEKNLPIASGIGGGSADAAAALRLLSRLWTVEADLPAIAARLGADVPVCLASAPARMEGIGDRLGPAPTLPPFGLLLVNPGVAVATPAVFRARAPGFRNPAAMPPAWPDADAMVEDLQQSFNDLQDAARALAPAITDAITWLQGLDGCLLARMSGSGATCFALFRSAAEAAHAATHAPNGWWAHGGEPTGQRALPTQLL